MRWASAWTKRNAILAIPAAIAVAYVAAYIIAFPRYGVGDGSARLCGYDWQRAVWLPLALVEKSCRGSYFEFISTERFGGSPATLARDVGVERVWP